MTAPNERAKRLIGGIYSWAADTVYEPVVVRTMFPLLGGDLHDAIQEQGHAAVATADGRPILDLPVGTAYYTVALALAHPGLVVGVDIAQGMVAKARDAAREYGAGNLVALRADAHRIPISSGSFGAILCTNGLQVMPGLGDTLAELERVLAPGGALYTSVITLPVSTLLPARAAGHLPTILKGPREIILAIVRAGLTVTGVHRQRFAQLIEARKPALAGVAAVVSAP